MEKKHIPDGYMEDQSGRLIPIGNIKPIDLARNALVNEIAAQAQILSDKIAKFKAAAFGDIAAFVSLSAEEYGVKLGGTKGNITLMSFNGQYKVVRAIAEHLAFDERLQAAKALIDQCISDWSAGSRPELHTLVNDAFQVDKAGQINTGRILGLRRLEITDPRWLNAMRAIGEAVQVVGSKAYVRVYERAENGEYIPIPLDVAGV